MIPAADPRGPFLDDVRPEVRALPHSGIVEVFDYGRGRQGLIPLWVGEGDLPTPRFICDAAAAALAAGETFYTYQGGIPELRATIAAYMTAHYGRPATDVAGGFGPERFFVTCGGMHALQMAVRLVAGTGRRRARPDAGLAQFRGRARGGRGHGGGVRACASRARASTAAGASPSRTSRPR